MWFLLYCAIYINFLTTSVGWRYPWLLPTSEVLLHSCMVLEFSQDSGALDPRAQTRAQFWGPSTVAWCRNLPQWCGVSLENTSCRSPPTLVLLFSLTTFTSPHQSNEELFQQHMLSRDALAESVTVGDFQQSSIFATCHYQSNLCFHKTSTLFPSYVSENSGKDQQNGKCFRVLRPIVDQRCWIINGVSAHLAH